MSKIQNQDLLTERQGKEMIGLKNKSKTCQWHSGPERWVLLLNQQSSQLNKISQSQGNNQTWVKWRYQQHQRRDFMINWFISENLPILSSLFFPRDEWRLMFLYHFKPCFALVPAWVWILAISFTRMSRQAKNPPHMASLQLIQWIFPFQFAFSNWTTYIFYVKCMYHIFQREHSVFYGSYQTYQ